MTYIDIIVTRRRGGKHVRLPFDRRGTVNPNQMPTIDRKTIAGLSDEHLLEFMCGWKETDWRHHLAQVELRRRENAPARWAIAISVFSLLVSVIALFVKGG